MKRDVKEPVLVLANGIGLWRSYDEGGDLSYVVRVSDKTEIQMSPEEWELILSSIKTDQFNEEDLARKEKYRSMAPPMPPSRRKDDTR